MLVERLVSSIVGRWGEGSGFWCFVFAGAKALSNVWAPQQKDQRGPGALGAPGDLRRALWSTDGVLLSWEPQHRRAFALPLNLIADIHFRHHCNGYQTALCFLALFFLC